jgi:undecaprenyl-diphosphatase
MVAVTNRNTWIWVYILIILITLMRFGKKGILTLLLLVVTVAASDRLTSGILKPLFDRTRPCHIVELKPRILANCSDQGSMPSSHAANHFALAVFMSLMATKRKYIEIPVWIFWAVLISYSRVYVGVHYPSDILIGAIIGAGIGWMFFKLNGILTRKLQKV